MERLAELVKPAADAMTTAVPEREPACTEMEARPLESVIACPLFEKTTGAPALLNCTCKPAADPPDANTCATSGSAKDAPGLACWAPPETIPMPVKVRAVWRLKTV